MEPITINDLPYYVLVEIFQFVPFEDLVLSVQFVSKLWKSVAQDPALWKGITFKPTFGMDIECIKTLLKNAPLLRGFEFRDGIEADKVYSTLFTYNQNLTMIAFGSVEVNPLRMIEVVNNYPNLEYLQLPISEFVNNITVLGKLKKLKKVKCVQLTYPTYYPLHYRNRENLTISDWCALRELELASEEIDESFDAFITKVRGQLLSLELQTIHSSSFMKHIVNCTNLERLKVNFMARLVPQPDLEDFFSKLRFLSNLKYLTLSSFVHTDVNVLCEIFQGAKFPSLLELNLPHCLNFCSRVAKCIALSCPQLKGICLKGCTGLDDSSVCEFSQCNNLINLDISGCPSVSERGLSSLAQCKNLRELNLNWNGLLSSDMLKHIGELNRLSVLHLNHTEISMQQLVEVVKKLEHLKFISVYRATGVDPEQLQDIIPSCMVQCTRRDMPGFLKEKAKTIQHFSIHGVTQHVLNTLPECCSLERLAIDFLGRPSKDYAASIHTLKNIPTLQRLSLKNFVSTKSCQLNEILLGLPPLRELALENCLCVDVESALLFASGHPNLEKLCLRGCVGLNDMCVNTIAKINSLTVLDIAGCCEVTEKGLMCLNNCKCLKDLNIIGILLDTTCPKDLFKCILSLPKLHTIHIENYVDWTSFLVSKGWTICGFNSGPMYGYIGTVPGETVTMYKKSA